MITRKRLGITFFTFWMGCHHPAPPPNVSVKTIPSCGGVVEVYTEDLCDGLFTEDGLPCARCTTRESCATSALVWCASARECDKAPECKRHFDPINQR